MRLPNLKPRHRILVAALAVTLVASVVSGREKPAADIAAPATPAAKIASLEREPATVDLDLSALQRPKKDEAKPVDLFAPEAAPGIAARPGEPAKAPAEPPLPFTYLGKVIDDGKLSVFLTTGTTHYSVQQGQTVAKEYRVDRITEAAITFTYLPTGSHKTLAIPRIH